MTTIEYAKKRQEDTLLEIKRARANRAKLIALKAKRTKLAKIYDDDGASHTANCIRTIDLQLIDEAIKLTE